jgi:hypothetical protein
VTVARAQYELKGGRALLAGILPSFLAVCCLVALLTLGWLAEEATSPDLSPDRYGEPASPVYYGE